MKTNNVFILTMIILVLYSCKQEVKEIDPVALPEPQTGMTLSESNQLLSDYYQEVINHTVGRKLPDIRISDSHGKQFQLRELISKKNLILISDAFCSFGAEGLSNDYPKALQKIREEHPELEFDVFCLLVKPQNDEEYPERFRRLAEEVEPHFPDYYIISEEQARSINYLGGPTRYFVNKEGIVTNMGAGISLIEGRIFRVLLQNLRD
ncbi:MAG: hypothetical protein U5Q03_02785 [Bacteroidota bacterium]|nr:hypothetical protein [Bacteroidota bacterium]